MHCSYFVLETGQLTQVIEEETSNGFVEVSLGVIDERVTTVEGLVNLDVDVIGTEVVVVNAVVTDVVDVIVLVLLILLVIAVITVVVLIVLLVSFHNPALVSLSP